MATGTTFAADIRRLVAKYKTRVDDVVKQSVQELSERAVTGTPVDTGFARASWWSSVDNSRTSHPSPPAQGGGGAAAISPGDIAAAPGHVFQLRNGAAYIRRLEFGHSAQAPSGWVRLAIADFPNIVAKAARDVGAR